MEATLEHLFSEIHWGLLGLILVGSLLVLGKAADWLVNEAVVLSECLRIPKVVIGATIVSLGTTMPEAAVSVFAAFQGRPGLALGNAVGSIICDTGLILGLACIVAPLRLDRKIVNRQGWIQLTAALALVAGSVPWRSIGEGVSNRWRVASRDRSSVSGGSGCLSVPFDSLGVHEEKAAATSGRA